VIRRVFWRIPAGKDQGGGGCYSDRWRHSGLRLRRNRRTPDGFKRIYV
jgi:hypothetical protein